MGDLVYPGLQRANPAADEGPEQIISGELLVCVELLHHLVDGVNLEECFLWIVGLVKLVIGWGEVEQRQVDEIFIPGVLHVEERPLPLAAGFQPEYSGKDRALLG